MPETQDSGTMKLICLYIPFLHFETYRGYRRMAQIIMQGRQPPPRVSYWREATKKPSRPPVVIEAHESSEDDGEELSTFKRILRRTQKLRSTLRGLKKKMRLKPDNTEDRVDLEKGAGTENHEDSFSNAAANIEPREDGVQHSGTLRDGKNTDSDEAMETLPTIPSINERNWILEEIDEGRHESSTEIRSIEERRSLKDTKTDSMETSVAPKSGLLTENVQMLSDQQSESRMQEPQVIPLLKVTSAMEQSIPLTMDSEGANSNQHVSDAGEGQQSSARSLIRVAGSKSTKGKGKGSLDNIGEENTMKPEDHSPKAGAAIEQDSTSSRPRKVRIPLGMLDEHLVKGYLSPNNPMNSPLQLRRSLDQYFYTHLASTSQRDRDQVVYRYTKDHSPEPKIFMVDQLWLWIFNDGTHLLYVGDKALTDC